MAENEIPDEDLPEQLRIRREKRAGLLEQGIEPYPVSVPRTSSLSHVRSKYAALEIDVATGDIESLTGRIIFKRDTGKLCFATLREGDGTELQAMFSLDKVGETSLDAWKSEIDLGDIVSVTGEIITSKRGELSILANSWKLAAKSLRPLPNDHKPMSEETRVRMRYVDLIVRPEARTNARMRPAVMRSLRETFHSRDYLEVETPMLQVQHGGAAARPFKTLSNAYDMELFLRIAPELFLKRCVVGGIERVFEINRNFRNEGADSSHSPEFAMIESYEAYADWRTKADLARALVQNASMAIFGSHVAKHHDGRESDLGGTWKEISLYDAISDGVGESVTALTPHEELKKIATKLGIKMDPNWITGKLAEEIFEHVTAGKLTEPTFVMGFPIDNAPLVRAHRELPGVVEKWDLYVDGFELATGYSELIDPVIQRERLVEQARLGAKGDVEAMSVDEDFLRAMEFGMPPMGGLGMGVDRLLMALTGLGIRETILFPLVKPEVE
ncbi:MAG: lysine--tRNA ligase [Actinobacteria bacterium]|uniref:lysine--tRNA ligase n=1 Tax=freshwater metagenome TaxID=449393 RepID=A0A6J6T163_9ZZZZ|nr:lysine--tRNA ligase [Actinomycetota bacterium]MSW47359.1 lysine--tRNA ligase [Actinomycetota bacterium]MSX24784.1 lysine--tRNA ligase [Actinomycetota bacterium]MSY46190.1 lysine--tRNA ligase [Actinomycetota bacterium]MSY56808.1 lysine--tRNA ligase [Actinomycetota bacterium]